MEEATRPNEPACEQPQPDWLKDIEEVFNFARAHVINSKTYIDSDMVDAIEKINRIKGCATLSEGSFICVYCDEPTPSQMLESDKYGEPYCPWCACDAEIEGDGSE